MNLKAITIFGLFVLATLIGTVFVASQKVYTIDETTRSEVRDHVRDHMGDYGDEEWWLEMEEHIEDHWDEMDEHWDSNSISGHGCH